MDNMLFDGVEITDDILMELAKELLPRSYAPYSHVNVGAALLTKGKKVYFGCNVENASYGATMCAERAAIYTAIAQGDREFEAIAITGIKNGDLGEPFYPCGMCLQVMKEFCGDDFKIIVEEGMNNVTYTLKDLLPKGFSL